MKAVIDKEKCVGCGLCVTLCPVDAITLENDIAVVSDVCVECGACVGSCPVEAISLN